MSDTHLLKKSNKNTDCFSSDAKAASRFADLRFVDIVVWPDVGRHPRQEQLQLGKPAAVIRRGAGEEAQRDHEPGRLRSDHVHVATIRHRKHSNTCLYRSIHGPLAIRLVAVFLNSHNK